MGIGTAIARFFGFGRGETAALPPSTVFASSEVYHEEWAALDLSEVAVSGDPLRKPPPMPTAGLQHERARDAWIEHPAFGLVPARLINILRSAEMGLVSTQSALIDDQVEADAHYRALLMTRETAVSGKSTVIQADAPDELSQQAAQVLWDALDRLAPSNGLKALIQHQVLWNRYGFSLSEISWGVVEIDGKPWIVPTGFYNVPARRFRVDPATQTFRLLTEGNPGEGEALIPGKWVVSVSATTDIARSGIGRTASRYCLLKSTALSGWAAYGAKFGNPLSIVYFDAERGEDIRENAVELARNIGNDVSAAVPDKIKVDVVDAGRMGDSSPLHGGLINYVNNELSKLILGSTLTSDSAGTSGAGSSHALGKVHENSKWAAIVADAEAMQETFYGYVSKAFIAFNGLTGLASPPRLKIQIARDMDPTTRAAVADVLVNKLGVSVSVNQLRSDTGYAEPSGPDDEAAGAPKPEPPNAFGGGNNGAGSQ